MMVCAKPPDSHINKLQPKYPWTATAQESSSGTSSGLYVDYFKQLFAQVSNPPIDPFREAIVMSLKARNRGKTRVAGWDTTCRSPTALGA